jgi:hypothetical protein
MNTKVLIKDRKTMINQEKEKKENLKSKVKVAGVKSVLVEGDTILMTSFGKGNKANIEKKIKDNNIIYEKTPGNFKVQPQQNTFIVEGNNRIIAKPTNPIPQNTSKRAQKGKTKNRPVGLDNLRAKEKLENEYFGKSFNDNIRIQLIYNILDIKKILAPYINNAIFAVNNLRRKEKIFEKDLIGTLSVKINYQNFCKPENIQDKKTRENAKSKLNDFGLFLEESRPYMPYMGNAFIKGVTKEAAKDKETGKIKPKEQNQYRTDEEIYDILRLLSLGRQSTFHDYDLLFIMDKPNEELKEESNYYLIELKRLLDSLYNEKIYKVNQDFIKNNEKSNFKILFLIFNAQTNAEKKEIIREYYDFIVKKDCKNLGFSLRKMREKMLEIEEAQIIKNKEYNNFKSKLYTLIDFIIYKYFITQEKENNLISQIVDELRNTSNEEEKEQVYISRAKPLWHSIKRDVINVLLPMMDENTIKSSHVAIEDSLVKDIFIDNNALYFSKYIYFLTLFLDGKEINELISELINKFENIQSFIDIIKDENEESDVRKLIFAYLNKDETALDKVKFNPNYKLFDKSREIAENLRAIKSFARMEGNKINSSREQFYEAARILGTGLSGKEEIEALDKMYYGTKDKNLRNFIANNVLQSNRFKYLARYCNTNKCREIANNKKAVEFVLKKINANKPEQIDRYYISIFGTENKDITPKEKIGILAEQVATLTFKDFLGVNQKAKQDTKEGIDKERKKALVNLYFTIIYLLYKNLININFRYVIAFNCLERDSRLYNIDIGEKRDYYELTKLFIEKEYLNRHARENLELNISNASDYVIRIYRNTVTHFNTIASANIYAKDIYKIETYFDLYHYIMQREIYSQIKEHNKVSEKINKCFENMLKMRSYSKDLLNILNTPFGYNLPRYKNLSIKDLFDKNEKASEKEENGEV